MMNYNINNSSMNNICNLLQSLQIQSESQGSLLSSMPSMPAMPMMNSIISPITSNINLSTTPVMSPSKSASPSPVGYNINNNNNNNNNTFSPIENIVKQTIYSADDESLAKVHFLWECGVWTTSIQQINNFDTNLLMAPKIAVIEPKCFKNFDKLSRSIFEPQMTIPSLYSIKSNGSGTSSIDSILSTNSSTNSVDRFDDASSVASGISGVSNFSYQPIISRSSSPSPKDNNNNNTKKSLGSFKNYVFFSNRLTSVLQRKLGKNGFGLEYQALYQFEARKFQYSMLRGNIRIIKDYRNNNDNNPTDYLVFKFGRASSSKTPLYGICERNDRQPERQPWCCQHIMTLEEMIEFFGLQSLSMQSKLEFLSNVTINDQFITKRFNPNTEYNANISKITRMLRHGFYDFQKGLEKRQNEYMSDSSTNSNNSRRSRKSNKNNRNDCKSGKLKNEDKFSYLSAIAHSLGVQIKDLLNLVGDAIENAFIFARKYPQAVLTQGYIDEERGTLSFELVLEAEIYDRLRGIYYKFAVPIVESKNEKTGQYFYEAKNILTPKMAVDNIRLNCKNAQLNKNTWINDLHDWSLSFYRRVDYMWFDNIAMLKAISQSTTQYVPNQTYQNYFYNYTPMPQMNHSITKPNIRNNNNNNNNSSQLITVSHPVTEMKEAKQMEESNSSKSTPTNNRARKTPRATTPKTLQSRQSKTVVLDLVDQNNKITKSKSKSPINSNVFTFTAVKEEEEEDEYNESDIKSDDDFDSDDDNDEEGEDMLPMMRLMGTLKRLSVDASDERTPRDNYGTFSCVV